MLIEQLNAGAHYYINDEAMRKDMLCLLVFLALRGNCLVQSRRTTTSERGQVITTSLFHSPPCFWHTKTYSLERTVL